MIPKVSNVERLFYGILTGVAMFAAYFLIDVYLSAYDPALHVIMMENQMYYLMGTFFIGVMVAQLYFWWYKKGLKPLKTGTV